MAILDAIDRTIILAVYENCRISYEALAQKVKLTPNAVKSRVHNLIAKGVLTHFLIVFNPSEIDAESFQAIILTDGSENPSKFVSTLGLSPMIGHVNTLATVQGGAYLVWGEFIGTEMLHEVSTFLRNLDKVHNVDLYAVLTPKREPRGEFSKLHLRVLKVLQSNPLMQTSEIAQLTGISAKTVRRALKEIAADGKVSFRGRADLAAGSLVNIHIRIEWDEKTISLEKLVKWLNKKYPVAFWFPFPSATEPMMIAEFVVEDLQEAERISSELHATDFVKSSTIMVAFSSGKFSYLSEIKLSEILDKVDEV